MKNLLKLLFVTIALNSCREANEPKHASFFKIKSFIQAEKRIQRFNISSIDIDKFYISEYKKLEPNTSEVESRKLIASYDLTLKSRNKSYKTKAQVFSLDSVNWEISKLSISNQTDSISKHFEETITWEYPNSLNPYHVTLKISDK